MGRGQKIRANIPFPFGNTAFLFGPPKVSDAGRHVALDSGLPGPPCALDA